MKINHPPWSLIDVSLGIEVAIVFSAVGLMTVAVATLIPIVYIVRLNPKKVLL